jgi:Transposase
MVSLLANQAWLSGGLRTTGQSGGCGVPSCVDEADDEKKRRKFDARVKPTIALEALREKATIAAAHHRVHPNQIYGWKRQLIKNATRSTFKIGHLPVFLASIP